MPESVTTGDVRAALTATLDRVESRLVDIARVSQINALLSMADPALVLPSPAVGIMQVISQSTTRPTEDMRLRSREAFGPAGEVILTLVDREFVVHPWQVNSAAFIEHRVSATGKSDKGEERLVDGIRIELVREENSVALSGQLSLHIDGGRVVEWGMQDAVAVWNGQCLTTCRRALRSVDGADGWEYDRPLHHHLAALSTTLFHLELPPQACSQRALTVEILFEDSIPVRALPPQPEAIANAALVWNSRRHRYPEFSAIGQATSRLPNRTLHPLSTFDLGEGWIPYSVINVVGQKQARHPAKLPRLSPTLQGRPGDYALVFLPESDTAAEACGFPVSVGGPQPRLGILLAPDAMRRLDTDRHGLTVDFRATTGSNANGIPAGTEFEQVNDDGLSRRDTVTGCLLTPTWGGTDGIAAFESDRLSVEHVHALLPAGLGRSIGNVICVLEQNLGHLIEIVDVRDFLRQQPEPLNECLYVRVRMTQPRLSTRARRTILRSCESFLGTYLRGNHCGNVQLVCSDGGDDDHDTFD